MIRCQLRLARSWASTAITPISIRRPISSSAGMFSRRITWKYSERGSEADSMIFITIHVSEPQWPNGRFSNRDSSAGLRPGTQR